MKITLSPIVSNQEDTPPSVKGEVLTYRGQDYDLSQLPNGGEVEADEPFVGKIIRDENGLVSLTLQYCYCTDTAEPMQSTDINDYIFDVTSGECPCPIKRRPESEIDLRKFLKQDGEISFSVGDGYSKNHLSLFLDTLKTKYIFEYSINNFIFTLTGNNATLYQIENEIKSKYGSQ